MFLCVMQGPFITVLCHVSANGELLSKSPSLKGSYDVISSFPFSFTSCLWIDKIPKVAKTKVSNPKSYSL